MPPTRYVPAADAVDAAAEVGYPSPSRPDSATPGDRWMPASPSTSSTQATWSASITRMRAALGDHADFVLVQAMVDPGVDLRVRVTADDRMSGR